MKDKDLLVDRVSKKTNVKKEDIFKLANDLQKKDLNNEKDMRDFIQTVAKVTKNFRRCLELYAGCKSNKSIFRSKKD